MPKDDGSIRKLEFVVNILDIDGEIYAVSKAAMKNFLAGKTSPHPLLNEDNKKIQGVLFKLIAEDVPVLFHDKDFTVVN